MRRFDVAAVLMLSALVIACGGAPDAATREGDQNARTVLPNLYEPGVLSTADYELNAAFSPSGDTLLFTRSAFSHWWMTVFITVRDGDGWSRPEVAPFSGRYSDADAIYTPDGSAVYFISDRPVEPGDSTDEFNLWRAPVSGGEFGEPDPLPAPVRSERNEYFPAVARGGVLYFSTVREDGVGGYDLLRAEPEGQGWSEPVLLPETINKSGSEIDVIVDPDERFLIFAAYGREDGLGSGDLYVSFRTDEGWTESENLGAPVNSAAREYAPGLSPDGEWLFVTSERTRHQQGDTTLDAHAWDELMHGPGNGQGDIYRYRLAELPAFRGRGLAQPRAGNPVPAQTPDGAARKVAALPAHELPGTVDLVIEDTSVFDVRTGRMRPNRTVVIDDGRVRDVIDAGSRRPHAARTIDGRGRSLTPGLIDAHSHLAYLLGDSVSAGGGMITRLSADPDSVRRYRREHARQYLPHGVTTVRDAGSARQDVSMLVDWMKRPVPWAPDVYPAGGALVSHDDGRTPFPGHRVVADPEDARAIVRAYHDSGIRHVKLYWRLREPEFRAALDEATRLGMNVTGHIDYKMLGFGRALDLGLRSFEHAYTVGVGALTEERFLAAWRESLPEWIGDRREGRFYLGVPEYFVDLGPDDPDMLGLIDRLAETESTVVPTLHLFAQRLGLAHYDRPPLGAFDDMSGLTDDQLEHFREGYELLAGYVRRMHRAGVRLAVGTDWIDPGRAVLSEMLLLHHAGIPMSDVLRIATLEGARALGLDDVGAVEPGMKAHLVLFQGDPLASPDVLLAPKTVIKDGVVTPGRSG